MLTCDDCGGLTPPDASRTCLHCDEPLRPRASWALKLSALLGPVGAILLAACYGAPGRYRNAPQPVGPAPQTMPLDANDADGDGSPLGTDCDDEDRSRYPGAPDEPDGIDQDCDGVDGKRAGGGPAASPPATIAVPPAATP